MKNKLILIAIVLFTPVLILNFYYPSENNSNITNVKPPITIIPENRFLFGALQSVVDDGNGFGNVNDLGLNMWHSYIGGKLDNSSNLHKPWGWNGISGTDQLDANVNNYASYVSGVLDSLQNNNNMRAIMQRPKIEWLCYGQRSDYQCEPISGDNDLFFYSFQSQPTGRPVEDSGGTSMFCRIQNSTTQGSTWNSPGFVCKYLKCNTEQCRPTETDNQWQQDGETKWHIKPRVRIDETFANNPLNWDLPVFSLKIINETNNIVKNTVVTVRKFLDENDTYDGRYLEEFNFAPNDSNLITKGNWGSNWQWHARGDNDSITEDVSKVDIQVYWYGLCDMWIDYVRVDNDIADGLLNKNSQNYTLFNSWLNDESNLLKQYNSSFKCYIELIEFNNIPCIAYVSHALDSLTDHKVDMMTDITHQYAIHCNWNDVHKVFNAGHIKRNYIDKINAKQIFMESYPLTSNYVEFPEPNTFSKIPNTLTVHGGANVLSKAVNPADYDQWLQDNLDYYPYAFELGLPADKPLIDNNWQCGYNIKFPEQDKGNFRFIMQTAREVSRQANVPFISMLQAQQWFKPNEVRREPTAEELSMLSNLSISYGAKGIVYYWYSSHTNAVTPSCDYSFGLVDGNNNKRTENVYRQPKWDTLKKINNRIKIWEPHLMSFDNTQTRSYIYKLERDNLLSETYFYDVASYILGNDQPDCNLDAPDTTDAPPPENLKYECFEDRYLQVATFKTGVNDPENYFMIVNRRCSPVQEVTHNDGRRYIRVFFDRNSQQLQAFSNWSIMDLETGDVIDVVNIANVTPYADLGWFDPGAGKLYKMVSTVKSGGILAGDENITGESFTCEAPVYNNGHNITIGANTTIHFNDSSKFVMSGGVFTVGDQNTSAPQNITSDAVPGGTWRGHSFTNCEVKIYGATFTGLANDTTYAVNIIDCPVVDIRNCTFNTNSSLKGGVNAICFNNPFIAINNIYIGSNTFNSSGSTIPTVNVSSYAGVTTPLIIENNTFNEGNTAVFLSGVIGGAIKGNTITDNYIGINALTSSIDVVQNNISSTVSGSMGIFAAGGSELKLNSSGAFTLGGLNNISNEGTGSNNINVDGSYFLLDDGENIFNISSDQSSYHLYGYFPMFTAVTTEETNNCFKVDDSPVDPPINMVTSGYQGSQITFNFNPYLSGCEIIGGGDGLVINLGDGIYDTIYTGGSGSGGSQSSVESELSVRSPLDRSDIKIPLSRGVTAKGSRGVFVISTAKQRYDSISVLMRYRSYTQAKTKCLDLINTYPDSIQSIFAVSKLFLATVAGDTSYNAANTLKIFYENLILNHPGNTSLVKRANYYILKCKVRMREYSQALAGFQQIINQNPYSYEGLIARWDYMATSLLIQGQGGAYSSVDFDDNVGQRQAFDYSDIDGNDDDKKPFTKEQRQDIRKSINTAIEISKNDDEVKIKKLEEKSELGDVNASKELTQMKSLKQVVKTEKPKSIIEHVRIVSEDIRKVFGTNTSSKGNEPKNIPLVFRLSQNYPNPFNPVTKINYDLPRDSKVKIVIYDILGREVKRLVNNELKTAGSYIVDFNASNYASGVYFYRIEAEETNGNKFVDSKKMVLLK